MPVFRIAYATPRGKDETEWVCPMGYTTQKARETFKHQSPSASVATIIRLPEQEAA